MRRRGSMLEMRGAAAATAGPASLSGSDNSINSLPARRATVTRRSFGDPPPLPGKKAAVPPPLSRVAVFSGQVAPPTAPSSRGTSSPSTPPATAGPPSSFSGGHRVTIVHRPTKEARKAEIVAAVTKRLYTQKKKPEPGTPGWSGWASGRADVGVSTSALPDTSEEAEDEPRELKLCSNARAKLQEISKRALALHLHRKRRDQEAQTESPGTLRVREKACGTDIGPGQDKACQHPHPFFLEPLWAFGPPWGLWGQRPYSDEALSDDSLELEQPPARPAPEPPPTATLQPAALLRAFSLRSGGRFQPPGHGARPRPKRISQGCQATPGPPAEPRKVDVGTVIARDAGTMTRVEAEEAPARDAATMTVVCDDKATMTTQVRPSRLKSCFFS